MSTVICNQFNHYCESVCLGILTQDPQLSTLFQLLRYLISLQLLFTGDIMLHFIFCALKYLRERTLIMVCIFLVTVPISFLVLWTCSLLCIDGPHIHGVGIAGHDMRGIAWRWMGVVFWRCNVLASWVQNTAQCLGRQQGTTVFVTLGGRMGQPPMQGPHATVAMRKLAMHYYRGLAFSVQR